MPFGLQARIQRTQPLAVTGLGPSQHAGKVKFLTYQPHALSACWPPLSFLLKKRSNQRFPAESKVWQDFRAETQQGKASKLPKFSRAAYQRGEICIPYVESPIFNVSTEALS
jgi:hypothetical protein